MAKVGLAKVGFDQMDMLHLQGRPHGLSKRHKEVSTRAHTQQNQDRQQAVREQMVLLSLTRDRNCQEESNIQRMDE